MFVEFGVVWSVLKVDGQI